ncbi:MAG: hypothetical protein ABIH01_03525, partial [Candidatus Omnitrophota bacterium]
MKIKLPVAIVALFVVCNLYATNAVFAAEAKIGKINAVEYDNGVVLAIDTTAPVDYIVFPSEDGKKIIVDFLTPISDGREKVIEVNKGSVATLTKVFKAGNVDFITVELTRSVQYEDSLRGGAIILDIKNAKPGVPVVPKPKFKKPKPKSEAPKREIEFSQELKEDKEPQLKEEESEAKSGNEGLFHGEPMELPGVNRLLGWYLKRTALTEKDIAPVSM